MGNLFSSATTKNIAFLFQFNRGKKNNLETIISDLESKALGIIGTQ